jgi:3-methylcrotonyl-CoA carboxylase alpha subunit
MSRRQKLVLEGPTGNPSSFEVQPTDQGYRVRSEAGVHDVLLFALDGEGEFLAQVDGQKVSVQYAREGELHYLRIGGTTYALKQIEEALQRAADAGTSSGRVVSPMPGLIARVMVERGQVVDRGDALFSVEAMKMENVVTAPFRGRVSQIHCREGEQLDGGTLVLELEASPVEGGVEQSA